MNLIVAPSISVSNSNIHPEFEVKRIFWCPINLMIIQVIGEDIEVISMLNDYDSRTRISEFG